MIDAPHFRGLREIFFPLAVVPGRAGVWSCIASIRTETACKKEVTSGHCNKINNNYNNTFDIPLFCDSLSHTHTLHTLTHTGSLCHSHTPTPTPTRDVQGRSWTQGMLIPPDQRVIPIMTCCGCNRDMRLVGKVGEPKKKSAEYPPFLV